VSIALFEHLGFEYEGTLKHFGPNGETCRMYARFFGSNGGNLDASK
jgi:RimJ/RimL family protein N-acetyltransferase